MLLAVNPNRMELLKLKRRLLYAHRGHDLLEDKLQQMLHLFTDLLKRTQQIQQELQIEIDSAFKNLLINRLLIKKEKFLALLESIEVKTDLKIQTQDFMGIKIPFLKLEVLSFSYPLKESFLDIELAVKKWIEILPKLIKFSQQIKTCQLLAEEIERIRRRVNALEYLLIPSITQTIHYIQDKLNEQERAGILRLLRIKKIIRGR